MLSFMLVVAGSFFSNTSFLWLVARSSSPPLRRRRPVWTVYRASSVPIPPYFTASSVLHNSTCPLTSLGPPNTVLEGASDIPSDPHPPDEPEPAPASVDAVYIPPILIRTCTTR
ncbi:hypothetical protein C8Q76DRAFT_83136 [Earliella scabrosa]|nr:hypothetical protein C8Q76DRAFT_83136 [Earliella scabrosa]